MRHQPASRALGTTLVFALAVACASRPAVRQAPPEQAGPLEDAESPPGLHSEEDPLNRSEEAINRAAGDPHAEACGTEYCLPAAMRFVRVGSPDVASYGRGVPRRPPVTRTQAGAEVIHIYVGEAFTVVGDIVNGQPSNLRAKVPGGNADFEIALRFHQGHPGETLKTGGTDMFLTLNSTYAGALRYRAFMELPPRSMEELRKQKGELPIQSTSSCPLEERKDMYEHWPHPIYSIYITQLAVVDEASKDAGVCR